MARLTEEQISTELETVEWERRGDEIMREWKFPNFHTAMALVNVVADLAEAANHHPDILVHGYNRVRLTLTTHSAHGLTERDFDLARRIDALA